MYTVQSIFVRNKYCIHRQIRIILCTHGKKILFYIGSQGYRYFHLIKKSTNHVPI